MSRLANEGSSAFFEISASVVTTDTSLEPMAGIFPPLESPYFYIGTKWKHFNKLYFLTSGFVFWCKDMGLKDKW